MTVTLHLDKKIPYIVTDEYSAYFDVFKELQLCAFAQGIINLNQYCGADNPEGETLSYRKILKIIERDILR